MTQASETRPRPASSARRRPNPAQRTATYYRQIVAELGKVIWPTRNELVTYTIVTIVFVAALVAFVAALDYGFTKLVLAVFG